MRCERETVGVLVHLVAEAFGKIGEGTQLERLRRRMNPAEERHAALREVSGDRLIRGQHELLDHLMADVMLAEMGAAHPALIVVFQLDFRHVQLQRPRRSRRLWRIIASSRMRKRSA